MKLNPKIAKVLAGLGLSAAAVMAGSGTVSYFEGKENKAYVDPVGIVTICYGETKGVKKDDYKTDEQCLESLASELVEHERGMLKVVRVPLSTKEQAAYLSFTYNLGVKAFTNSTLLKKLNSGDRVGACNELLRWNKANGKVLNGLTKRRQEENKLCLEGVADLRGANETNR